MPLSRLDLLVMAAYAAALIALGLFFARRASRSAADFFASGRSLPWWVAGTSMIAASFASDTPLLVTGYVRTKGVWGNWAWWSLGISTLLSTFLFARLWHRSGALTETELCELRYAGRPAAALRAFKAVFWGLFYASWAAAGPVVGLTKMVETNLGWDPQKAILACAGLAILWAAASGLWGVVASDVFQFAAAVLGSLATAHYAVIAAGGWGGMLAAVPPERLALVPPAESWSWFLAFLAVQWWAWKNADGGGVLVQRMAACRNERHAVGATLWYSVGHYALRCWPWVLVALASLVLFPAAEDHEAVYGMVVARVLPAGVKGFVLAWFLAEFMTGMAQFANFGAAQLVHDGYRRFLRPAASEREAVWAARAATALVISGAALAALFAGSVRNVFETILQLTAGVGTVYLGRWLWWRTNAWSEIAAMVSAIPLKAVAPHLQRLLEVPDRHAMLFSLVFMVVASAAVWLPATLLTEPVPRERLLAFYRRVRPPPWGWGPIAGEAGAREAWGPSLARWLAGTAAVYAMLLGIGGAVLGRGILPLMAALGGLALLAFLVARIRR